MNIRVRSATCAVLITAVGSAAGNVAAAKDVLGQKYRAIGVGKNCDDAEYNARHAARIWRKQNCPAHHISVFASDAGFDPLDPKAYKVPDDRVKCMKSDDEFYIYRDVTCVIADADKDVPKKADVPSDKPKN